MPPTDAIGTRSALKAGLAADHPASFVVDEFAESDLGMVRAAAGFGVDQFVEAFGDSVGEGRGVGVHFDGHGVIGWVVLVAA
mmetsp:Transcript_22143/g.46591  ORF Transcript_22143/g.46591 Transcript_22143/m.46591 type:complete len:82 (+) Transcript_22143:419-664(+)